MSIPTIAATRVYIGGEEKQLSFETFPYTGLSKVNKIGPKNAISVLNLSSSIIYSV